MDLEAFRALLERLEVITSVAFESGEFGTLDAGLLDAVTSCATADQLWRILSLERLDEATFVEDEHLPELAHALIAKARSFEDPGEAADTIGLAVRAGAFSPAPMLHREADHSVKDRYTKAIEVHRGFFRANLGSPSGALRSASAHALARCRTASEEDACELLALAHAECDKEALAALLLALGTVLRRGERASRIADEAATLFEDRLGHGSLVVRTCAAAGRALLGGGIDARATAALVEAIETPAVLPAEWGWRWQSPPPETTAAIAVRLFGWARASAPEVAIRALATLETPAWLVERALLHLAFADEAAIPRLGLVLEELDDKQRVAVAAMGKLPWGSDAWKRFGLWHEQFAAPFLDGKGALFRPLAVEAAGGHRRWHAMRIWRGVLWGEISEDAAVGALTKGLSPEEVLEIICTRWRSAFLQIRGLDEDPSHRARDDRMARALVERLLAQGFEPAPVLTKMAEDPGEWSETMRAVCQLAAKPTT